MSDSSPQECAYLKWRAGQPDAQIMSLQGVFEAGYAAGADQPCPECEERDRDRYESDEGMRNAFEMIDG